MIAGFVVRQLCQPAFQGTQENFTLAWHVLVARVPFVTREPCKYAVEASCTHLPPVYQRMPGRDQARLS